MKTGPLIAFAVAALVLLRRRQLATVATTTMYLDPSDGVWKPVADDTGAAAALEPDPRLGTRQGDDFCAMYARGELQTFRAPDCPATDGSGASWLYLGPGTEPTD